MNILCKGAKEIKDNYIETLNKLENDKKSHTTYFGNFSKIQKLKENYYSNKIIKSADKNEENISRNNDKREKINIDKKDFTDHNSNSSVLEIIDYPKDGPSLISEKHNKLESNVTALNRETVLMKTYNNTKNQNNKNSNKIMDKYLKKLNKNINPIENNNKVIINKNDNFTGNTSNISESTIIVNSTIHFMNTSKNFEKNKDNFNTKLKQNNSKIGGNKKEIFMKCISSKVNFFFKNNKKNMKKNDNYSININSEDNSTCPKKNYNKINNKNDRHKDQEIFNRISNNNKLKDVSNCIINKNKSNSKINSSLNIKNNPNKNKLINCLTSRNILSKNNNAYNNILYGSQKNIKNVKNSSQTLKNLKLSSIKNIKNIDKKFMKKSSYLSNANINKKKIIISNNNKNRILNDASSENLSLGIDDKLNPTNKMKKSINYMNSKNEYLKSKTNPNTINNKSPKKRIGPNKIVNINSKNLKYFPNIKDKIFSNKNINIDSNNNTNNKINDECATTRNYNINSKNIVNNKYIFDLFPNKNYINKNNSTYDLKSTITTNQKNYSLNNQEKNISIQIKYEKIFNNNLIIFKEAKQKYRIPRNQKNEIHPQIFYFRNNAHNLIKTINAINNNFIDNNKSKNDENSNIIIFYYNKNGKNNFNKSSYCFEKRNNHFSEKKKNSNKDIFFDTNTKNKIKKNNSRLIKHYIANNIKNKKKYSFIIEKNQGEKEKRRYTYSKKKINDTLECRENDGFNKFKEKNDISRNYI